MSSQFASLDASPISWLSSLSRLSSLSLLSSRLLLGACIGSAVAVCVYLQHAWAVQRRRRSSGRRRRMPPDAPNRMPPDAPNRKSFLVYRAAKHVAAPKSSKQGAMDASLTQVSKAPKRLALANGLVDMNSHLLYDWAQDAHEIDLWLPFPSSWIKGGWEANQVGMEEAASGQGMMATSLDAAHSSSPKVSVRYERQKRMVQISMPGSFELSMRLYGEIVEQGTRWRVMQSGDEWGLAATFQKRYDRSNPSSAFWPCIVEGQEAVDEGRMMDREGDVWFPTRVA